MFRAKARSMTKIAQPLECNNAKENGNERGIKLAMEYFRVLTFLEVVQSDLRDQFEGFCCTLELDCISLLGLNRHKKQKNDSIIIDWKLGSKICLASLSSQIMLTCQSQIKDLFQKTTYQFSVHYYSQQKTIFNPKQYFCKIKTYDTMYLSFNSMSV